MGRRWFDKLETLPLEGPEPPRPNFVYGRIYGLTPRARLRKQKHPASPSPTENNTTSDDESDVDSEDDDVVEIVPEFRAFDEDADNDAGNGWSDVSTGNSVNVEGLSEESGLDEGSSDEGSSDDVG